MKGVSYLLFAGAMLVASLTGEAAAQALETEGLSVGHQSEVAALWPPMRGLTDPTASVAPSPKTEVEPFVLAMNSRSWMRYLAIGAGVGAVAASVYIYQQCKGEDCILHPLGPPVFGAVAGALVGLGVELLVRAVTSRH